MSLYLGSSKSIITVKEMLRDVDTIHQALDVMAALSSVVESTDPEKQLEVLAQTLAVDAISPSYLDGKRFWHGLLHFQCNQLDLEGDPEDQVFRLDALIEAGLEWQHRYYKAQDLYEDSYPEILSPREFYSKRKPALLGRLLKKTLKKFPLAMQARVRLQRSYVELYKARDRTREVQHTLPYKVAAEVLDMGMDFGELYNLCLLASEGRGCQEVVKAWETWKASRHPIHFLDLSFKLTEALVCFRDMSPQIEPKLLEFLQYELPKSSWKFFERVNDWCTGQINFKINDPKYINFDFLHWLCQMDFPLSGKHMEELTSMSVLGSHRVQRYLSMSFGSVHGAEKVFKALQLDDSSLNSFDTSHWTETLVKVVSENSPRNLRSKDLVQIFKYLESGWSHEKIHWDGSRSQTLTSRQLRLVEKWIAQTGCEKLKALSELYNGEIPLEELPS